MKRKLTLIILCLTLVLSVCGLVACQTGVHTHELEKVEAVAATCTEAGNKEYYRCKSCDKIFADENYTEISAEDVVISALGHDLEHHDAKSATCTEAGWEAYDTCTRCDHTTKVEIDALGHDYEEEVTTPATCVSKGEKTYTCKHEGCTDSYTEEIAIDSNAHDLEHHDGKAATCTEAGWEAYDTCTRCDHTTKVEIPALTHDYEEEVTTPATCVSKGEKTYTCKHEGCTDSYTEEIAIDSNAHDLEHVDEKSATCTEDGYKAYDYCKHEGCEYTTYEVIKAGHTLTHHEKVDATCTEDGTIEYWSCPDCGKNFKNEACTEEATDLIITALGHVYDREVANEDYLKSAATVESPAVYYKSCKCGVKGEDTFTYGDPLPPDPEQIKIEAEDGVLTGTAMYGAASMIEEYIIASGGKELGCFCNDGNTATWTVTLNEDHENATLSFAIKSWKTTEDMSGVKITVNGEELAWHEGEKFKATDVLANVYKLYHSAKFNVQKGELVITIEIVDKTKVEGNFDYLTVNFAEISVEDNAPDPRTDENAVKIEAEDGLIKGTSQYPATAPDMIENNDKASGGKEIGCFGVNGNTVEWTFDFEEAADNVVIYFYAKSFVNATTDGFGIYVNGNLVEWFNDYFIKTTDLGNNYKFYASKPFSVEAGKRIVKLEVLDASGDKCAVNFDYVMLAGYGDVKVTVDTKAPVISDIAIDKNVVGEESSISYLVFDNLSEVEDITVTLKVYYDYEGSNQEEITVTDGKFVPVKDGFYTVIVTAEDAFGNKASEAKAFACGTPDDPDFIMIEAEEGTVEGTSSIPSYCPSMKEPVTEASNGYEIGCFAKNGNTATWTTALYQSHEKVKLTFKMKGYCTSEDMSGFKLTVNGTEIGWEEGTKVVPSYTYAYHYLNYTTNCFSVEKGTLTIKLEILDETIANANIDYLILTLVDTLKIEGEACIFEGTPNYGHDSVIESCNYASGEYEVGCFDVTGNTATWTVTLDKDYDNLIIDFTMKSYIDTADMSGFKVTVNGAEVAWGEGVKLTATQPAYADYSTSTFSANVGELVIVLEVVDSSKATANIDYLTIRLA